MLDPEAIRRENTSVGGEEVIDQLCDEIDQLRAKLDRPSYYGGETVHMEDVARYVNDRAALNAVEVWHCKVYEDGQEIDLPVDRIDEFAFTGLTNADFFVHRMWEGDSSTEES